MPSHSPWTQELSGWFYPLVRTASRNTGKEQTEGPRSGSSRSQNGDSLGSATFGDILASASIQVDSIRLELVRAEGMLLSEREISARTRTSLLSLAIEESQPEE